MLIRSFLSFLHTVKLIIPRFLLWDLDLYWERLQIKLILLDPSFFHRLAHTIRCCTHYILIIMISFDFSLIQCVLIRV